VREERARRAFTFRGWPVRLWPLTLLAAGLIWAPIRAGSAYPGLPCTASSATFLERAAYVVLFIPAALALFGLTVLVRRALKVSRRLLAAGGLTLAAAISIIYLVFAGIPVQPSGETAVSCPQLGAGLRAVRCWMQTNPTRLFELNAVGRRPTSVQAMSAMGSALRQRRQNVFLSEAFVYDTDDPTVVDYSNGRLFTLERDAPPFGQVCLGERTSHVQSVLSHRVGFYRYSAQQAPPVDAFFLRDVSAGETQYEVIDFLHQQALPFVRPADLQPAESAYLDRVASGVGRLNDDLTRETQMPRPAGALIAMRAGFDRVTADLASGVPARLKTYQTSRLRRFLENYDLILAAEENAAQGQAGQAIHTSAYEQHRRYYFQEARVTMLIGYLYLQRPGETFSDDELSTVNWAVF
jgi:hypothetical protein